MVGFFIIYYLLFIYLFILGRIIGSFLLLRMDAGKKHILETLIYMNMVK